MALDDTDPAAFPQLDPVETLQKSIDELTVQLQSGNPPFNTQAHADLTDKRDTLDEQQLVMAQKEFQEDDAIYKQANTDLTNASNELDREIATTQKIDKIITISSQIITIAGQLIALP